MAAPTLNDAIIDRTIPMHWLLDVRVGNTVIGRYSDSEITAGGVPWAGVLEMKSNPSLGVDVYTGRAQVCQARVSLAPRPGDHVSPETADSDADTIRPCDLESVYGVPFASMKVRLWRYVEGSAWTVANPTEAPLIDGYLSGATIEKDATLTVDLVDSTHRLNRKFPHYRFGSQRFTNLHPDAKSTGPNILYGNFTAVVCPVIDTSNYYGHAADGSIGSITQAYLDDASIATESLTNNATDAKGTVYSRLVIGQDDADKQLTADGTGYKDGAHGQWTGTASALITHPGDQLHHFARQFCDIPKEKIDHRSFIALRDVLPGWQTDFRVLGDEETTWADRAAELAVLYRGAVYEERGKVTTRALVFSGAANYILTEDPGGGLIEFGPVRTPDDEVPAEIRLLCDWGWKGAGRDRTMDWRDLVVRDGDDVPEFNDARRRGAESMEIHAPMLSHAGTEAKVINGLTELHKVVRRRATCVTDRATHKVKLLDKVRVTAEAHASATGAGCVNKMWFVTGITYGLDDNELLLLEHSPAPFGKSSSTDPGEGA